MCEDGNITAEDLRLLPRAAIDAGMPGAEPTGTRSFTPAAAAPPAYPSTPSAGLPYEGRGGDDELPGDLAAAVAETERAAIMKALEATRWNRTAAAKQLGLTLRQLRYRLEKLGIE